jgi:hypothetical protein
MGLRRRSSMDGRRPMGSRLHWTEKKGAKMNLDGRSSTDRRRPVVPRLQDRAKMGPSGRSSVDRKKTRGFKIALD